MQSSLIKVALWPARLLARLLDHHRRPWTTDLGPWTTGLGPPQALDHWHALFYEESAEGLGVAAGAAATGAAAAAAAANTTNSIAGGNAVDVAGQPLPLSPLGGFVQRRHHPPLGHGHGHGLAVTNGGPGPAVVQIQVPGRVFWIPQQYYPQLLQYLEQLQGQQQHLPPVANHAGANGGAGIGVGAGVGAQQGQHHHQQVPVPVPMPMPVPMQVPMPMPGQMQMMPGQGQPGQGAMPPSNQQYYRQPPINMVGGGPGGVVGVPQQAQPQPQQHHHHHHHQQQVQQAQPQYAVANQGWGQPQQHQPPLQQQQQGQPQRLQQPPAETGGVGLGAGGGLGGDGVGGPNDAVVAAAAAGVAAMNVGQQQQHQGQGQGNRGQQQQQPSQQNLAGTGTGLNGEGGEGGIAGGGDDAVGDIADDQQPQHGAAAVGAGRSTPASGAVCANSADSEEGNESSEEPSLGSSAVSTEEEKAERTSPVSEEGYHTPSNSTPSYHGSSGEEEQSGSDRYRADEYDEDDRGEASSEKPPAVPGVNRDLPSFDEGQDTSLSSSDEIAADEDAPRTPDCSDGVFKEGVVRSLGALQRKQEDLEKAFVQEQQQKSTDAVIADTQRQRIAQNARQSELNRQMIGNCITRDELGDAVAAALDKHFLPETNDD